MKKTKLFHWLGSRMSATPIRSFLLLLVMMLTSMSAWAGDVVPRNPVFKILHQNSSAVDIKIWFWNFDGDNAHFTDDVYLYFDGQKTNLQMKDLYSHFSTPYETAHKGESINVIKDIYVGNDRIGSLHNYKTLSGDYSVNISTKQTCEYNQNTTEEKWTTLSFCIDLDESVSFYGHTFGIRGTWQDKCDDKNKANTTKNLSEAWYGMPRVKNLKATRSGANTVTLTWDYEQKFPSHNLGSEYKWMVRIGDECDKEIYTDQEIVSLPISQKTYTFTFDKCNDLFRHFWVSCHYQVNNAILNTLTLPGNLYQSTLFTQSHGYNGVDYIISPTNTNWDVLPQYTIETKCKDCGTTYNPQSAISVVQKSTTLRCADEPYKVFTVSYKNADGTVATVDKTITYDKVGHNYQDLDAELAYEADCTHRTRYYKSCSYCGYANKTADYVYEISAEDGDYVHVDTDGNGKCDKCAKDLVASEGGSININTANDLKDFAKRVNAGNVTLSATLTTDIDLSSAGNWTPIGNATYNYMGTFDGGGHRITNMKIINYENNNQGLFGVTQGAVIKNFTLTGQMTSSTADLTYIGGVIGQSGYKTSITDVTSNVNITIATGIAQNRIGGIAGHCSRSYFVRCVNNGTLDCGATKYRIGGIVGSTQGYTSLKQCLNTGNITSTHSDPYIGGMIGETTDTRFNGCHNCLNTGVLYNGTEKRVVGAIFGHYANAANGKSSNNYYLSTTSPKAVGVLDGTDPDDVTQTSVCCPITADQLTSGEACFMLNNKQSDNKVVWRQSIGTDNMPRYSGTVVYGAQNMQCDGVTPAENSYTCSNTSGVTGSRLLHKLTAYPVKNATCTEEGYQAYWLCENACCAGRYYKSSNTTSDDFWTEIQTIAAKGHSFNYTDHHDATCLDDAYDMGVCANGCGTTDKRMDEEHLALGHSYGTEGAARYSCTRTGCGYVNEGQKVLYDNFENYDGSGNLVIADGKSFSVAGEFAAPISAVSVARQFNVDKPSTVMLPFSVSVANVNKADFYEFKGVSYDMNESKWIATMSKITETLDAYKPYLIIPSEATITLGNEESTDFATFVVTPEASAMATTDDETGWTFKALNAAKAWAEGDAELGKAYGFAGQSIGGVTRGDFVKLAAGASAKAGRCYLIKEGALVSSKARTNSISAEVLPTTIEVRFINGEITGIGTLDTETGEITIEGWYDLNGRRIEKPTKSGIYIKNNKKVLVK